MKRNILAAIICAVSIPSLFAAPKVMDVRTRPESVTRGFDGKLYITVMGEKEPGDGVVKVIDGDEIKVFATGLDEPKGITFVRDYLVTTDLQKVWKIDSKGNKTVLAEGNAFPHPVSYLNDAGAASNGKSVYVTDMGANTKMFGPKGLWPLESDEAKQIPAIGRVYNITLDGKVKAVVASNPLGDGKCGDAFTRSTFPNQPDGFVSMNRQ